MFCRNKSTFSQIWTGFGEYALPVLNNSQTAIARKHRTVRVNTEQTQSISLRKTRSAASIKSTCPFFSFGTKLFVNQYSQTLFETLWLRLLFFALTRTHTLARSPIFMNARIQHKAKVRFSSSFLWLCVCAKDFTQKCRSTRARGKRTTKTKKKLSRMNRWKGNYSGNR